MRGRHIEFLQPAAFHSRTFVEVSLQVFAQQIEAGRNSEIDHDHVRGLGEIVSDRCGRRSNVILREMRAIVSDGNRKCLCLRLFGPGKIVTADYLVRETSLAIETDANSIGVF